MSEPIKLSKQAQDVAIHLAELLKGKTIEVPMLPDVASRVLSLSNSQDSDAGQLAKLIQSDQALAGHVMRIANSAAYSPNSSLVSLQQAIARLGMGLISEIALAASVNAKLFKAPGYEKRIVDIWVHALATALWGKEVARVAKKNVEASFLCGLLHSIGRPVILQSIAEYSGQKKLVITEQESLLLEQRFHVLFGSQIVDKWEMPVIVREAVLHYQHYQQAKSNMDQAMIVYAGTQLATAMLWPETVSLELVMHSEVFADLNLYDDDLERLLAQTDKVKAGLEAMKS